MTKVAELMSLSGRKAFVTGAGGHVGLAVCETLLELGAAVVAVSDQQSARCQDRAAQLSKKYPTAAAVPFPCDLLDESAIRSNVQKAITEMGGLDILIHCAAYVGTTNIPGWSVPFAEQTVASWDAAHRVNTTAAFILAQECRHALQQSGHGAIVFFSSIYGLVGPDWGLYEGTTMANPAAYNASKAGLLQLTRYLATTLAPAIRVNAISPGGIWRDQPERFHARYTGKTPLGRMATEEDLKGATAYLASDLSQYVTGHNLVVDGGWTAW